MDEGRPLPAPVDRTIEVRGTEDGTWLRVRWDPLGVVETDGLPAIIGRWESRERDSFWLQADEIDGWRDLPPPVLRMPPLAPSPAWERIAQRLRDASAASPATDGVSGS